MRHLSEAEEGGGGQGREAVQRVREPEQHLAQHLDLGDGLWSRVGCMCAINYRKTVYINNGRIKKFFLHRDTLEDKDDEEKGFTRGNTQQAEEWGKRCLSAKSQI
uniref:Uncharacterized protein n=1 Tax=Pseudictyota dubia TaxID=2749911 RepID=A0A7R9ZAK3_9STRA